MTVGGHLEPETLYVLDFILESFICMRVWPVVMSVRRVCGVPGGQETVLSSL